MYGIIFDLVQLLHVILSIFHLMSRALLSPRLRRRPRVGDGENKSEATLPEFSLTPAAVAYPGPAGNRK